MVGEGCHKEHQASLLPTSDQPNAGMLCSVPVDSYLHPVGFAESGIKKRTFLIFGRLQKKWPVFHACSWTSKPFSTYMVFISPLLEYR